MCSSSSAGRVTQQSGLAMQSLDRQAPGTVDLLPVLRQRLLNVARIEGLRQIDLAGLECRIERRKVAQRILLAKVVEHAIGRERILYLGIASQVHRLVAQ